MITRIQAIEFILYGMQEKWTDAWNFVHKCRESGVTQKGKDKAVKWLLWLPHGLLHSLARGGEVGLSQCRDLANILVLWIQIDMAEIIRS